METGPEGGALTTSKEEGSREELPTVSSAGQTDQPAHLQQEKVLSSGIQLRTSARVSKKLRSDQEANAAAAAAAEKKCETLSGVGSTGPGVGSTPATAGGEEKRKSRRPPVLWSPEDKSAFFEALNENGKNFEAIQKYMTGKAKRRGDHTAKNREQARHFYYRTWHKLSKHIKLPPNINRVTQELYGLINFGELRKKVGKVTEKNSQKLNELIYSGSTQIRARGKTWRVKTPVCRILRRINMFDENIEEVRLPGRVEVLLTGRDNRCCAQVQALAHNPRVRTTLPIDSTLDTLINFLGHRWKQPETDLVFKVGAPNGALINQPSYRCGQIVTSNSVSLLAHEKRHTGEYEAVKQLLSQIQLGKPKSVLKWQKEETDEYLNTEVMDPSTVVNPGSQESCKEETKEEFENRIRQGWTSEMAARLRIGELYIMLGSNGAINLNYWWEKSVPNDKEKTEDSEIQLSKALQKLVSIAKLYYFKYKVECPCGHVCRSQVKAANLQSKQCNKANKLPKPVKPDSSTPDPKVETMKMEGLKVRLNSMVGMSSSGVGGGCNRVTATTSGGLFKQPLLPAPTHRTTNMSDAYKALQLIRPKYCNRRGRARQKNVVVQRMLPLLPKNTRCPPHHLGGSSGGPRLAPSPSLVTLQVIPQPGGPLTGGEFIKLNTAGTGGASLAGAGSVGSPVPQSLALEENGVGLMSGGPPNAAALSSVQQQHQANSGVPAESSAFVKEEEIPPSGLPLLSLALPSSTDDLPLSNTFTGLLGTDGVDTSGNTPPTSPSRILKEGESQWLNAEVSDFSLSSFLGHLESPLKTTIGPNGLQNSDDTRLSADVESHFQSLMTESSLDYTAKFADLAAKIVGSSTNGKLG